MKGNTDLGIPLWAIPVGESGLHTRYSVWYDYICMWYEYIVRIDVSLGGTGGAE